MSGFMGVGWEQIQGLLHAGKHWTNWTAFSVLSGSSELFPIYDSTECRAQDLNTYTGWVFLNRKTKILDCTDLPFWLGVDNSYCQNLFFVIFYWNSQLSRDPPSNSHLYSCPRTIVISLYGGNPSHVYKIGICVCRALCVCIPEMSYDWFRKP